MSGLQTVQDSSLGQAAQSLGAGKAALNKLKSLGKHSPSAATGSNPSTARDSLAHISVNLPEAPAIRHVARVQSASDHHRCDPHAQHPSADVLRFSQLPVSSADHVGSSVVTQTFAGQNRKGSNHNKVMISLPDSPKPRYAKQRSAHLATESNAAPQAVHSASLLGSTEATAGAGMHKAEGQSEIAPGLTGLFGDAALDAGPPCLSSMTVADSSILTSCHSSMADIGTSDADADISVTMSKRAVPGSSSVELPLGQSDFSR